MNWLKFTQAAAIICALGGIVWIILCALSFDRIETRPILFIVELTLLIQIAAIGAAILFGLAIAFWIAYEVLKRRSKQKITFKF